MVSKPPVMGFLVLIAMSAYFAASEQQFIPGGYSPTHNATARIQKQIEDVTSEVLKHDGGVICTTYKAISYRGQVVSGENNIVKVQLSETAYVHVKIFVSLPPSHTEYVGIQLHHTKTDPITVF